MKNKQVRKDAAFSHLAFIESTYPKEIQNSIAKSCIYEINNRLMYDSDVAIQHQVTPMDSVSAVEHFSNQGKIALLDFASYKNPGGGFMNGSLAQEEAICAESTLYPVLLSFQDSFYIPNRSHINRSLYTNRSIYVPDVLFFKNQQHIATADVIVCAAPNFGAAQQSGVKEDKYLDALKSRINSVFRAAGQNDIDILIAGAFGCGVFKNDPNVVANLFKEVSSCYNGTIGKVVYAIPNENSDNYKAFDAVFNG